MFHVLQPNSAGAGQGVVTGADLQMTDSFKT